MKAHLAKLISKLQHSQSPADYYQACTESENIEQLIFLFKQSQQSVDAFDLYQRLMLQLVADKPLPCALFILINALPTLDFFLPAIKQHHQFLQTDLKGRSILHYLFAARATKSHPPFNYIRAMMLFESNENLAKALSLKDNTQLSALEVYFMLNHDLTPLPKHELNAVIALIEIEHKQHVVEATHYPVVIRSLKKLVLEHHQKGVNTSERSLLIATYYQKDITTVNNDLTR